jgi:hypothetical protein
MLVASAVAVPVAVTASVPAQQVRLYDAGVSTSAVSAKPVYKRVPERRCSRYRYSAATHVTTCTRFTVVRVNARFLGSIVQTKNSRGVWARIPYVWSARLRALVYSHWLDLQLRKKPTPVVPPKPTPTPTSSPSPTAATPTPTVTPSPAGPSTIPQPAGTGVSPTPTALIAGEAAGRETSYSYLSGSSPTTAAHWDKCTPITWSIDLTRAPEAGSSAADELARWSQVFSFAARVTGYDFRYVAGGDGRIPATGAATIHSSIDITYGSPNDPGAYVTGVFVGGVIGKAYTGWSTYGPTSSIMTSATVILDYDWMRDAPEVERYDLFFHEFGHALGLGHVNDVSQVMNPSLSDQDVFRLGDRTGLWQLAQDSCFASS